MSPRVSPQEGDVGLGRGQPQERLSPARRCLLADRGIARERGEQLDPFPPRLLPVGEELPEGEAEPGLARRPADHAAKTVARLFPATGGPAHRLVILESEIAGRSCVSEQLPVLRSPLGRAILVDQLARLREQRAVSRPHLDLAAKDGDIGVPRAHLFDARQGIAGLLEPPRARMEPSQRGERLGVVRRRLEHLLPGLLRLVGPRARLPIPRVPRQSRHQRGVVRRVRAGPIEQRRGGGQGGDQRARPRHRVSHAVRRAPSAPNRKRPSTNPRPNSARFWS